MLDANRGERAWQYHRENNPNLITFGEMVGEFNSEIHRLAHKQAEGLAQYLAFMEDHGQAVDYVLALMGGKRPAAVPDEAKVFDVLQRLSSIVVMGDPLDSGAGSMRLASCVYKAASAHANRTGLDEREYIARVTSI